MCVCVCKLKLFKEAKRSYPISLATLMNLASCMPEPTADHDPPARVPAHTLLQKIW